MSHENELFFEFLGFKDRQYYHQGDPYNEYSGNLDTFLEDIKDYDCNLYLVGYDSGRYDFMLGTNVDKEQKVLEDFYEMLLESDDYGPSSYSYNEEEPVTMDTITTLDMDTFITIEDIKLDTEEITELLGKVQPSSFDDLENYLEDNTDFYERRSFNTNVKSYGVKDFINWVDIISQDMIHPSITRLTSNRDNKQLFIMLQDKYDTRFISIEPNKDYFITKNFDMIYNYMEKNL